MREPTNFELAQRAFTGKIRTYAYQAAIDLAGKDRHFDQADIEQELLCVLWRCTETYDPNNGATFNTFVQVSFRRAIASMIRYITAIKRSGHVVTLTEGALEEAGARFSDASAEDYAIAEMTVEDLRTFGCEQHGGSGAEQTRRRA